MKTPNAARIPHLTAKVKPSTSRTARRLSRSMRFGALLVFIAFAATFYSSPSASSNNHPRGKSSGSIPSVNFKTTGQDHAGKKADIKNVGQLLTNKYEGLALLSPTKSLFSSALPQPVPQASPTDGITIDFYDATCLTLKSEFILGETVCVKVANVDPNLNAHVDWVGASDGIQASGNNIATGSDEETFTIPLTAGVGSWRVNVTSSSDGAARGTKEFVVRDVANPAVDLALSKLSVRAVAEADTNATFEVALTNNGPDAATDVVLTDPLPENTTFVSMTQNEGGTSFTCEQEGQAGSIICTAASMPAGDKAIFHAVYKINSGVPNGTVISSEASVAHNDSPVTGQDERRPENNASTDAVTVGEVSCKVNCPADITQGNDQNQYGATVEYITPEPDGSCGTVEGSPASGTFFEVGTHVVTITGENGSPCSFNITVNDTQAPTIDCPDDYTTFESSPGSGSAMVNYPPPTASDNDPAGATVSCDKPSGSNFTVNGSPHLVTCTATDAAGNSSSCTFNVTVESTQNACPLTCPQNITQNVDANSCGAVVNYEAPASTTGCTVEQTAGLASGSTFPVGTTTNTFRVTDENNNSRSCSFTVTVVDNEAPTFTAADSQSNLPDINADASGSSCQANVSVPTPATTDNCPTPAVTVTGVRDDGAALNAAYPVGTTVITWTARDGAGNASTAEQNVRVRDTEAPTVNLVSDITMQAPADTCQVEVPQLINSEDNDYGSASDNCAAPEGLIITQTPAAGTLVSAGDHTITVRVCDGDPDNPDAPTPNCTTKTTTLHVIDSAPPTITLNGDNPVTVECHTSFNDPGATAHDTCAGDFAATSDASTSVNVDVPGTYTVTYTASDPSGNAAEPKTRTVHVVDTIKPTITLNGSNPMVVECGSSFTDPGATASDSCDSNVPVTSSGSVNTNAPGTYTITYNAEDDSGNDATPVTRTVIVQDTSTPTITLNGQTITYWPPNHSLKTVNVSNLVASASDGCDSGIDINDVVISKVTSDEPVNGGGDGNTSVDIIIAANCKSVQLRSERAGNGNGRVYTITFKVTDASGNSKTKTAQVKVPKNNGNGGAVDSGVAYTVTGNCP